MLKMREKSKSTGSFFAFNYWFSVNGKSTFRFQFHFSFGYSEQEFKFSFIGSILIPLSILFRFSFSEREFKILNGWWIFFQFNSVFRSWKTNLSSFANCFLDSYFSVFFEFWYNDKSQFKILIVNIRFWVWHLQLTLSIWFVAVFGTQIFQLTLKFIYC